MKNLLCFVFTLYSGIYFVSAQTDLEIKNFTSNYNTDLLSQLEIQWLQKSQSEKEAAIAKALQNGWPITQMMPDGSYIELQKLSPEGKPIYYTTFNVDAARSTRTNHVNSGGSLGLNLNGQNMIAHVWDGGIARVTHQEYDGAGGIDRFSVADGSTSLNFHAAHVTGTIIASGVVPAAKGMAPHSRARGYDWNNDLAEATNAAANGMLISNHSYGYRSDQVPTWWFGAYITESRNWDNLLYNSPYYLMVVAAGNDGTATFNTNPLGGNASFDKLTGHAVSKNNIVVANAQDANVATNGDLISVAINSSSSQGPTDDYRIKPDITGNGTGVYSTYHNSNTAYNSISGTSMASPNVAGSLLLLQQHYNNINAGYMRAATLKGLALHTADDAGIAGPDAIFGWGLLNTKRAAETITTNGTNAIIEELVLNPGQTYTITVQASGNGPLQASISWTDLPGVANTGSANNTTPRLVNDLDLRVSQNSTIHFPWRLTSVNTNTRSDNNVDPFERVDVANANGTYTITVTHKGSLSGGPQAYTLIITGIHVAPIACNATVPTNISILNILHDSAEIQWDAVSGATYDIRYRVAGTSTWTTQNVSTNSYIITGLSQLTSYNVQVRSICASGSLSAYSSTQTFTTIEQQLSYCSSNGNSTSDEYISRVQLGTINNSSGAGSGGYSDFTALSTDLTKGQPYTISITPTWTGTVYNEGYAVWIDYNKDGIFSPDERVFVQNPTNATPVSGSFTVPTEAQNGATRMRVSLKYNGVPTPCESFQWGEVEDYTVNIVDQVLVCSVPSGLSASNITETSASLSWGIVANASNYEVRIRRIGTSTWNSTNSTNPGINASSLEPGQSYEFQVKTVCSFGESAFSGSTTFTTVAPCNAPSGLSSNNVTINSAQLTWTTSPSATSYTVRFRIVGTSTWTTVAASTNNTILSGLNHSTTYEAQVSSNCSISNSPYSSSITFSTLTPCDTPTGLNATNISENSATLSWTSATGASSYEMRIRPTGGTWQSFNATGNSVNVNGLASGTGYEFQVRSICGNNSSVFSSISSFTTLIPCTAPSGLVASNITINSVTLAWNVSSGASSYAVRYRIIGSTSWTTTNSGNTTINVSGLQSNTNYEAQVASNCSSGTSSFSSSTNFTTPAPALSFCTSRGNNASFEWIRRVRLNEIDNTTGSNGGYGNFTNLIGSLQRGTSTSMNIQAGFSGTAYTQFWRVWIDLNQNGTFESNELLVNGSSSSANLLSATLNIPSTALLGATRMRVSMKYNAAPGPCETFPYGEVEDYTVVIVNTFDGGYQAMTEPGQTISSLGSESAESILEISPNPAKNELFIKVIGGIQGSPIQVFNGSGIVVDQYYLTGTEMILNIRHLPPGLYFLSVNTERSRETKKVIVYE